MNIKTGDSSDLSKNYSEIVVWGDNYATGIELIDNQHKELVNLTNRLYRACMGSDQNVEATFKEIMSKMVEYVRFHFTAEQNLLKNISFPHYSDHTKEHNTLIKNILDAAKEYNEGNRFTPNNFVRTLKDWVFGHIAFSDKIYSAYIAEQKKKGLLSEKDICV